MSLPGDQPEVFRADWAQTWRTHIRPFLISNILVALVAWVLGYALGGPIFSVLLPIILVGGMTLLQRYASHSQGLRLSGHGIEFLRRNGSVVRLRWSDIERIEVLAQKKAGSVAPTAAGRAAAGASAQAFADANTGAGLIGNGDVLTTDEEMRYQGQPQAWQTTGQPVRVNMPLVKVDTQWATGRIGELIYAHRPDLFR
jgi:hypothetical protein